MRVLLDESLPRRLARHLGDIEVETVFDRGWTGLKNGELLTQASADFTVFVTADQNLRYQQNLKGFDIGVVVLAAPSNRIDDLLPLVPAALTVFDAIEPGEVQVAQAEPERGGNLTGVCCRAATVDGLGLLGLHLAARPSMVVRSRVPKSLGGATSCRSGASPRIHEGKRRGAGGCRPRQAGLGRP